MELAQALNRWAIVAHTTRPPGTVRRYRCGVARLVRHGIVTVEDLTRVNLARFADERHAQGISSRTSNTDMASAAAIVGWLVRRGEAKAETLVEIRAARLDVLPPAPPDAYTREEYATLVLAIDRPLVRLAFRVACLAGPRISELRRLKKDDFDFVRGILRIRGRTKNHKERTVSICGELRRLVEPLPDGYLFPSHHWLARDLYLSGAEMERVMRRVSRRTGIKATMHKCRRTFVTESLLARVPPSEVARMAGHDLAVMVKRYAAHVDRYEPAIEGLSHDVA